MVKILLREKSVVFQDKPYWQNKCIHDGTEKANMVHFNIKREEGKATEREKKNTQHKHDGENVT